MDPLRLGEKNGRRLSLRKRGEKNLGWIIQQPDSPRLIEGVGVETGTIHPDDRGYFAELFRVGASVLTHSLQGCASLQISATLSYPGVIKALHYHYAQTDYWAPVQGMFQVVLCDLREGSRTHGEVNTLFLGLLRPWRLRIPPGVGHGYKVVGEAAGILVYLTDKFYDGTDEGRVEYNHPYFNYDWELQHR